MGSQQPQHAQPFREPLGPPAPSQTAGHVPLLRVRPRPPPPPSIGESRSYTIRGTLERRQPFQPGRRPTQASASNTTCVFHPCERAIATPVPSIEESQLLHQVTHYVPDALRGHAWQLSTARSSSSSPGRSQSSPNRASGSPHRRAGSPARRRDSPNGRARTVSATFAISAVREDGKTRYLLEMQALNA